MITAKLRRLANRRAKLTVHVCNGDPHKSVADKDDRDANATAWGKEQESTERQLEREAKAVGLTVRYPGLYPTFDDKDGRTYYL